MNFTERPLELLQSILEGFVDGILVITEQRTVLYANTLARQYCAQHHGQAKASGKAAIPVLPDALWRVCESLIESQEVYGQQPVMLESEFTWAGVQLRLQVQWLHLPSLPRPCLLVRLQDQQQATQGLAIAEAQLWHLTTRETEVWCLRRSGLSRKQIAAQLYIAEDTAKKHLRNIQMKRQIYLDEADQDWPVARSPRSPADHPLRLLCSA